MKLILIGLLFFLSNILFAVKFDKLTKNEDDLGSIHIVFKPTKGIDKSFKFFNGLVVSFIKPDITIFDGNQKTYMTLGKINVERKKVLIMNERCIIIKHNINSFDYFDYVFEKDDSIIFNYVNSIPVAVVKNKKYLKYDYNFEKYFQSRFIKEKYSPLIKFLNPKFFYNFSANTKSSSTPENRMNSLLKTNNEFKNKFFAKSISLLNLKNSLLDSLKEQKLISEKPYYFYKDKINNLVYILEVETNRLSIDQIKDILAKHTVNPYNYPEIYHEKLLEAVEDKYITEKSPFLDLKDEVNRDYRQVYARLNSSSIFSKKDKNYLLTREINRIGKTFSRTDFLSFFKKFEQDVKDTVLVNSVKSQYSLEFSEDRSITKSIILTDLKNNKITFDNLLKRYKGKVIYVDFWASWCGPCREALPQSIKLRNELKGKNVVFVYLSIDKTMNPWQTASVQEKLDTHTENYLVVNYTTSEFMKQQKLTSIPRYMIFNKQGKLVYANAPSVESKNLAGLLTEMTR